MTTRKEYSRHNDAIARRVAEHFQGTGPDIGEMLQRKAASPLRPSKPQAPADQGLFSDDSLQTDLVDAALNAARSI